METEKSVSDIFATTSEDVDEDTSEEYYNRQPSGRVVSPTPFNHPSTTSTSTTRSPGALCASSSSDHNSSSEEEIEGITTSTPATSRRLSSTSSRLSSTANSFISPLAKVARTLKNHKSVLMKYLTVSKNPEKDIKNKTEDMRLKYSFCTIFLQSLFQSFSVFLNLFQSFLVFLHLSQSFSIFVIEKNTCKE